MVLAANLQAYHKVDISWELMPLLSKSEKFRKFASGGSKNIDEWSTEQPHN